NREFPGGPPVMSWWPRPSIQDGHHCCSSRVDWCWKRAEWIRPAPSPPASAEFPQWWGLPPPPRESATVSGSRCTGRPGPSSSARTTTVPSASVSGLGPPIYLFHIHTWLFGGSSILSLSVPTTDPTHP